MMDWSKHFFPFFFYFYLFLTRRLCVWYCIFINTVVYMSEFIKRLHVDIRIWIDWGALNRLQGTIISVVHSLKVTISVIYWPSIHRLWNVNAINFINIRKILQHSFLTTKNVRVSRWRQAAFNTWFTLISTYVYKHSVAY